VRRPGRRDRGSATIWVVGLIGLVWSCAITVMVAGGVRDARHRARLAADLAAIAAAARETSGHPGGCDEARRIAAEAGAQLDGCVLSPSITGLGTVADVTVTISLSGPSWVGVLHVPATARAGPADPALTDRQPAEPGGRSPSPGFRSTLMRWSRRPGSGNGTPERPGDGLHVQRDQDAEQDGCPRATVTRWA
jgi:secretion/DNA translocation related TadE-like protein